MDMDHKILGKISLKARSVTLAEDWEHLIPHSQMRVDPASQTICIAISQCRV